MEGPADVARVGADAADPTLEPSYGVGLAPLVDFFARALGMMLIGVALCRLDVLGGNRTTSFYCRLALWGLGVGLPLAISDYLAQTGLGLMAFSLALAAFDATRTAALVFVLVVSALELWWSQAWLSQFRFGPVEWLWRCATYWRMQPLSVAAE